VCTAYDVNGKIFTTLPASGALMAQAKPVYEELPGWHEDTSGCRRFEDLPARAQAYVRYIQDKLGTPVCIVSVGPEREQAMSLKGVM
jgi:adenylosuccinate synthase